jgi:hypothetical protein
MARPSPRVDVTVGGTTTVGGVVSSTSNEATQLEPQQTVRTLWWLAALNAGRITFMKMSVRTEKATPTPPPNKTVFGSDIFVLTLG